ncbi:MAG: T9SS C-terminal target domain-containing protein [Chitinophagaceae bacterium]|nr:MAG: T9SS C-terminal target domain-containing protein [Chitinophagaceae bacterium]
MKSIFLAIASLFISSVLFAQTITHGPIIGGVTDNSARILIRTVVPFSYQLQISPTTNFSQATIYYGQTSTSDYNFSIKDVSGLQSNTRYYYRVVIGGSVVAGPDYFYTFPCVGESIDFAFHFGSCTNNNVQNDVLFDVMQNYNARFFLHLGDWLYPDTTDNLPNNTNFYANDYDLIVGSYKGRYSYPRMSEYLKRVPVDWVYDDHDYVNDNTSRTTASYTNFGVSPTIMEIPFPPQTRRNLIEAYYRFFPGYEEVDSTEGIFHSFRFGNTEVFMIDNRSARSPNTNSLKNVNGQWVFDPDPDHTMLGDVQRAWLLDKLKNSTATWKFIGSGTAFNRTYGDALQSALNLPNLAGLPISALLVDSWSGFPLDQDTLINWINAHNIDGVVMMSGDTHTSAIGNAQTGGITEMMAGCLSQSNSTLYTTVPLLNLGLVWSEGGQGIDGNLNTNNAFGNVEVFGDDSVRLTLIDEQESVLATYTVYSCSYQSGLTMQVDSVQDLRCADIEDGKVYLSVQGGAAPYQFYVNGVEKGSEPVLSGLPAGRHLIGLRDSNGCSLEACVEIESPPLLEYAVEAENVVCHGDTSGSIQLSINGGVQPYQLNWENGQTSQNLQGLNAGLYIFEIEDENNCVYTDTVTISEPLELTINAQTFSPNCHDESSGRIFINTQGGTAPYGYIWADGSLQANRQGLSAGNYAVTVTDSKGCEAIGKYILSNPDPIEVSIDTVFPTSGQSNGAIDLTVSGGTAPFSYSWNTGETVSLLENLSSGFYQVTVTDARGCEKIVDVFLPLQTGISGDVESPKISVFPNPAGEIFYIALNGFPETKAEIKLFNSEGKLLVDFVAETFQNALIPIDISDLPGGFYLLHFDTNEHIYREKLFIQR